MTLPIRRLGPGDSHVLEEIARDEADFDPTGLSDPQAPLEPEQAAAYLAHPDVLHWIADDDGVVAGHLLCHVLRRRAQPVAEILVYEIGVRHAYRERGIGRSLVYALTVWMHARGVMEAWVTTDTPEAVEFYRDCGFEIAPDGAVYMSRIVRSNS